MRIPLCPGEALRLCASCARNVDHHPREAPGADARRLIRPVTRGERCFDWYPKPPEPTPPTSGA